MANQDRDTVYTDDGVKRTVYTRDNNSTGWFVGIVVALALLAIAYLVFSANSQPSSTNATINNNPAATTTTPLAPADTGASIAPMAPAPTAPGAASTATPAAPAAATDTSTPAATTTSVAPSIAPSIAPSAPAPSAAQ